MSSMRLVKGNTETPVTYGLHYDTPRGVTVYVNDCDDLTFYILDSDREVVTGSETPMAYVPDTDGQYQADMPVVDLELGKTYYCIFHAESVGYRREYQTVCVPN